MIRVTFYISSGVQRRLASSFMPVVPRVGEEVHVASVGFSGNVERVAWCQDVDDTWSVDVFVFPPLKCDLEEDGGAQ